MRIKLKPGVKVNGAHFQEHIARMVQAAAATAPHFTDGTLWITSANDSTHRPGSKHYSDEAFDVRTRNILAYFPQNVLGEARAWVGRMEKLLGADYDVIFEGDHIHVEYDPK